MVPGHIFAPGNLTVSQTLPSQEWSGSEAAPWTILNGQFAHSLPILEAEGA